MTPTAPRLRRAAAALVALALAAGGVLVTAAPASAVPVASGTIDWGFRESFRNYVPSETASGGATVKSDGTFSWTVGSGAYDPATRAITANGDGDVVFDFTAHTFVMTIADPQLTLGATTGVINVELTVKIVTTSGAEVSTSTTRVDLARLDLTRGTRVVGDGTLDWAGIPATLTAEGAEAFAADISGNGNVTQFYSAGDALDPVGLHLTGGWPAEVVAGDSFTEPGTTVIAASRNIASARATSGIAVDEARGLVYELSGSSTYRLEAASLSTGEIVPDSVFYPITGYSATGRTVSQPVVDPRTGSLFYTVAFSSAEIGRTGVFGAMALAEVAPSDSGWAEPVYRLLDRESVDSPSLTIDPATGDVYLLSGPARWIDGTAVADEPGGIVKYPATSLAGSGVPISALSGSPIIVGEELTVPVPGATSILPDWEAGLFHLVYNGYNVPGLFAPAWVRTYRVGTGETFSSRDFDFATTPPSLDPVSGRIHFAALDGIFRTVDGRSGDYTVLGQTDTGILTQGRSAYDPATQRVWLRLPGSTTAGPVVLVDVADAAAPALLATLAVGPGNSSGYNPIVPLSGGRVLVGTYATGTSAAATARAGIRVVETLLSPTVTSQPDDIQVELRGAEYGSDGSLGAPDPEWVEFAAGASGLPTPTVRWQQETVYGWADLQDGDAVSGSATTTLRVLATSALSGTRFRAVFSSATETLTSLSATPYLERQVLPIGTLGTDPATLTVTVAEPESLVDHGGTGQADGSVLGNANEAGSRLQVKPGLEVAAAGAPLTVDLSGFARNSNPAGVYAVFGYVDRYPSQGGSLGDGYDYIARPDDEGVAFVAWPDAGDGMTGIAQAVFDDSGNAEVTQLTARAQFAGSSGEAVDCFAEHIQCGVFTIGAHGGVDEHLESFVPVFFVGQEVTIPVPPVVVPPTVPGSLSWGVKSTFRSYITGPIAHGWIAVGNGASSSSGRFVFPQASSAYDTGSSTGSASYDGAVQFFGHGGILNLTFSDPVVRIDSATSAALLVRVNGSSQVEVGRIALGSAAVTHHGGGAVTFAGAPVTLTATGSSYFSYGGSTFYPAGTALDPVTFTIGADSSTGATGFTTTAAATQEWSPPATPPATEGIESESDEFVEGEVYTFRASGFQPGEPDIKVVVYSEPTVLETSLTADDAGVATWTGALPLGLIGEHTLTFQGSVNAGIVLGILPAAPLEGCPVEGATIDWGFKESFRAYIDGSIANGSWEVSGGATYATPSFGWADGGGVYDPETGEGLVGFAGTVRFTGHDGLLDTTIANPQLRFGDDGTAVLLLDVTGVTMEDAMAGNTDAVVVAEDVPFVEIDLTDADLTPDANGVITVAGAPTAITEQGYATFPNYEPGTAFDPITFTLAVADCAEQPVAEPAPSNEPVSDTPAWLWPVIVGAIVLLLVLVALLVIRVLRSRRR